MKVKLKSRTVEILMAATMAFTMAPMLPVAAEPAYAATGAPAMNMGSAVLNQNVNSEEDMPKVKFAGHDWYVIGYDGTGNAKAARTGVITLFHTVPVEESVFNCGYNGGNAYKGSALQNHIESWVYGETPHFSSAEASAMVERELEGGGANSDRDKMKGESVTTVL